MALAEYLTIPGSCAYSDFRLRDLERSIGARVVRALWLHYVHLHTSISKEQSVILEQLLTYGEDAGASEDIHYRKLVSFLGGLNHEPSANTVMLYIAPRTGTISPWSSKATSIAHVCGLDGTVQRIERGMIIAVSFDEPLHRDDLPFADLIHDRMTQTVSTAAPDLALMFAEHEPAPAISISLHQGGASGREALQKANRSLGLALDPSEIEYLDRAYAMDGPLARDPTDVELFMFAQVNSEHCRHKQFNADWTIDGMRKPHSLFGMIRSTHKKHPDHTISAYSDNAAVLKGEPASFWAPNHATGEWTPTREVVHYLAKVETHNHPTAVSPYPGAATGSGGEIRDEGAVGRGSRPKAGLAGFNVSDLFIPGQRQPWELDVGRPNHIASSLDIMIEAPIGSAAFNNEFGRPCLTGYFRTLLTKIPLEGKDHELRGYHKPILIAGGVGTVRPQNALKDASLVKPGSHVIVLGGPAMLIGLGGGAASSVTSGEGSVELDFASVQRGNPEMQRRAQMVIDACTALGARNPITLIHDVGAGGLSNALPELVHDAQLGATFELRRIDNADNSMSPLQIWCCEAQERYVMIIGEDDLKTFQDIARRERCGFSVVGRTTGRRGEETRLLLNDRDSADFPTPIDLPMSTLFGKPPRMSRIVETRKPHLPAFDCSLKSYLPRSADGEILAEAVDRVLALPSVGSKSFLITIGDRTVGGLTTRDQMVGPWQVPVADVAVTATSLLAGIKTGEAMAMGERPLMALISAAASARMAVAEALTNLAAADILGGLDRVRLSANWMAASSHPGEGAALYEAVEAIALELCPKLGLSIPVGKDSMSMKMKWKAEGSGEASEVTAPLSLVISAFAPVESIRRTWTPTLRRPEDVGETILLFVDLSSGRQALGGSALAQVFGQVGDDAPDVRDTLLLRDFYDAINQLHEASIVLAYHDRSDGGLFTTLAEMMFAGRCGLEIVLDKVASGSGHADIMSALFNEELGAVFQVRKKDETEFHRCFATCGPPPGLIKKIGRVTASAKQTLNILYDFKAVYSASRADLQRRWSKTSYALQRIRDNPASADAEHASLAQDTDPGLSYRVYFDTKESILPLRTTITAAFTSKPRVAILREQGVNGHAEMAFAFHSAGFLAIDVHMTDLISNRVSLASFVGLAACGGFSYGDVLGAGQGWAKSVLLHPRVRRDFAAFFARPDTFTLGVCNGAQFLTRLSELIPGASAWPTFARNASEQYEARLCMVTIHDPPSSSSPLRRPSVFLHGMHGSSFPIAVAHGEGRAVYAPTATQHAHAHAATSDASTATADRDAAVAIRYVDNASLKPTEQYPFNPNGSPAGITGVRSTDGRVLAMMPHPERMVLADAVSWAPDVDKNAWGDLGPWSRLFTSARRWVG